MSTEALLKERQSTHGEYKEHARCTQAIMRAVMVERNWQGDRLSDIQRESLHMFAHKMGRIAVGNPDEPDHWKDIAGYAVLVEQRLAVKPVPELTPEKAQEIAEHFLKTHTHGGVLQPVFTEDGHAEWTKPKVVLTNTPRAGETEEQIAVRERRRETPGGTLIVDGVRLGIGDWCRVAPSYFEALILNIQDHLVTVKYKGGTVQEVDFARIERSIYTIDTPSCGDGSFDARMQRQRTPEDGAQHASVTPWMVTADWLGRQEIDTPLIDAFWARRGEHYVLEPHVASRNIPRVLRSCYKLDGHGEWTLDIRRCPEDARDYFPNLYREKNMKEWEELPEWQRALYMWQEHPQKYVLAPMSGNEAWHVEAA